MCVCSIALDFQSVVHNLQCTSMTDFFVKTTTPLRATDLILMDLDLSEGSKLDLKQRTTFPLEITESVVAPKAQI